MSIYSFSILCFSFGVLLSAILVLAKRKDEVAMRFFWFSVSICGWGFPFAVWINQDFSYEVGVLFPKLFYIAVVFIPTTWLHFVMRFIGAKEPFKGFHRMNYFISIFCALTTFSKFFFSGTHAILEFKYFPTPGPIHHLHMIHFTTLVPLGLVYLFKTYRVAQGQLRDQLKYFVLGTIIGFTSGSSVYVPYYHIPLPLVLTLLMPLYPILMGIALTKYGLFEAGEIAEAFQREKLAAIGTMAASLNHEIRNPLYAAKGKIEAFLDAKQRGVFEKDDQLKKGDEVLSVADSQLKRALDIMQKFSDFAKPSNAKNQKEKVILSEVFQDVQQLASNELNLNNVEFKNLSPNSQSIYANRRQIEEIFLNLTLNACQAMEEKGGELHFNASKPNGRVIIEVTDTGLGIKRQDQKRIFDPFFTTKGKRGTGLGLYITKQLIERNNGKVKMKSRVGEGTTFILEFEP